MLTRFSQEKFAFFRFSVYFLGIYCTFTLSMLSRRKSRVLLLQVLFADSFCKNEKLELFYQELFDEKDVLHHDETYMLTLRETIHEYEKELLSYISWLAPKFEIDTMPRIHIIILMISLAEMLYWKGGDIDVKVSINEAIELAKEFSDIQGKNFVNGALATFTKKTSELDSVPKLDTTFFVL